jgi:hypothetical protein
MMFNGVTGEEEDTDFEVGRCILRNGGVEL